MPFTWDNLGEVANVAQLTGLDAIHLIGMIVSTASAARTHKKDCRQFIQLLRLIRNLLNLLNILELRRCPEMGEALEQLEDTLRRSYVFINSCQDRSYLYLLAMGWNIAKQFKRAQREINVQLSIIPLIILADNHRLRERPNSNEENQNEDNFDEGFGEVQDGSTSGSRNNPSPREVLQTKNEERLNSTEENENENNSVEMMEVLQILECRNNPSPREVLQTGNELPKTKLLLCM